MASRLSFKCFRFNGDRSLRNRETRKYRTIAVNGIEELVTDKGYHSGAVIQRVKSYELRSYLPEKQQKGRRNWQGKAEEQQAVYENRRRVRSEYGKSLLWRVGGTQLCALLRNRRYAALPPARTGQHFEATVGSCWRVQPESHSAPVAGCGHAARAEQPLWPACSELTVAALVRERSATMSQQPYLRTGY